MNRDRVSRKAKRLLARSGWTPDREATEILEAFVRGRPKELSQAAKEFILSFGGIEVGAVLWIWSEPHDDHPSTDSEERISSIIGSSVEPVASANYFSSNCVVWLDEFKRFYGADDDGMIYLAEGYRDFFDVVLFDKPRADPPAAIATPLRDAYEW